MGLLIRTENSLNQHIKLKHPDLWETIKGKNSIQEKSKKEESVQLELGKREEDDKDPMGFILDSSIMRKESGKSDLLGEQNIIDFGNNI